MSDRELNCHFDPQLSAELHNSILKHAWLGAGRDIASLPCTSWWEESSPIPFEVASSLKPSLIQFLRSAKFSIPVSNSDFHFFYYLHGLTEKDFLLRFSTLDSCGDRYVWLYSSTCSQSDEEVGIVFDQETELAAFLTDWQYVNFDIPESWPWKPLQMILRAYLEMIEQDKVTKYSDPNIEIESLYQPSRYFPWEIHQHTQRDVDKAVDAFIRLLDAIETRRPPKPKLNIKISGDSDINGLKLPYSSTTIDHLFPRGNPNPFARDFLLALPTRHISFRHIAPGIRIQTLAEIVAQPFASLHDNFERLTKDQQNPRFSPFLLFRADAKNRSPWVRPWFPDGNAEDIPVGLYLDAVRKSVSTDSGNESRLLLPFEVGNRGYARSGNGVPLSRYGDTYDKLYRVYHSSGILPRDSHSSAIHKVLRNWAERIEMGDWEVDDDGVVDGIEKFKDADTPASWQKYQTSWWD